MKWTIKALNPASRSVGTYVVEALDERAAILKAQAGGLQVLSSGPCVAAAPPAPAAPAPAAAMPAPRVVAPAPITRSAFVQPPPAPPAAAPDAPPATTATTTRRFPRWALGAAGGAAVAAASVAFFALHTPTAAGGASPDASTRPATAPVALAPDQLFAACSPAVVQIKMYDAAGRPTGTGSGFVITPDGLIVTNHHVASAGARAVVHFADGSSLPATGSVGFDEAADLCLLRVQATGLRCLTLGADPLPAVGTGVFAIGSPKGMASTLSNGLVSAVRDVDGRRFIQTNAPISHGSSGGPLMLADGRVIGVTTAGYDDGQNLNFAVPVSEVRRLVAAQSAVVQALPKARVSLAATLESAQTKVKANDFRGALADLESIEVQAKEMSPYWSLRAFALSQLSRVDDAIDAYRKAIATGPTESLPAMLLARLLILEKSQYQEALDVCDAALRHSPDDPDLLGVAGMACSLLKLDARAITLLERAVQVKPEGLGNRLLLAYAYLRTGRRPDATAQLREIIRRDPGSGEAKKAAEQLAQLR